MSYPPPGGQDPYQPLPPPEPESNPYAQSTPPPIAPTPPPAYQPYGQPYGQVPTGAPAGGNNGLAIGSMVTGIVSILLACCCSPLGIVGGGTAVVLGFIGMNQIKERGQANRGMAIAGIATGGAAVLLGIVLLIVSLTMNTTSFWNNYNFN